MSGFFSKQWYGQTLTDPGVYVKRNEQGGIAAPNPNTLVPLFIGSAQGGQPNVVLPFGSADAARAVLRGGDLVQAIDAAFSAAGPTGASINQALAIRLGAGSDAPLQASHTFKDSALGVAEVQSIAITGTATAGTFAATYAGVVTTGTVAYNAIASAIQTYLNTNSAITAAGGVTVTGTLTGGPIIVTFNTAGVRTPITLDISLATGATAAVTTRTTPGLANGNPVLTVTSADYGQYTNGIALALQPATLANGGYLVTLGSDAVGSGKRQNQSHDNTGRQGISLRYLGAGTACALTITRSHLSTACTGAAGDNLNIDLTATATGTLDKLAATINAFGGGLAYAASVVDLGPNRPANQMDLIAAQEIHTVLNVKYTGAGTPATLSVAFSATDTLLTTAVTGATADVLSIPFSGLTTIADLAAAIAGTPTGTIASGKKTWTGAKYTVAVTLPFLPLPVSSVAITTAPIDVINGSTGGNLPVSFVTTQHLQAVVDYLNSAYGTLVTASLVADPSGTVVGAAPLATVPATYLAGGSDGTIGATDWSAAFTVAEQALCQIVVALTGDDDLHMVAKAHCALMSTPQMRKERVAIVGGAAGETLQQAVNRASDLGTNFDGDYIQLVWPGVTKTDPRTGLPVNLPPYMAAAVKAGLSASLGAGQGATNKKIDIIGLETMVSQDDLALLINGGVTAFLPLDAGARTGFVVGKDIMTYQEDANVIKSLFISRMANLVSAKRVRDVLNPMIGEPNTKGFETRCRNILIGELNSQVTDGLLVATDLDGGWKALTIDRTTDTINVSYMGRPVGEIDFILIEANASILSTDS